MDRLLDAMMLWTIGSMPFTVAIEGRMCEMIELGIGLIELPPNEAFDHRVNYPVYISEPLVVLSLSSGFQMQEQTTRKACLARALRIAKEKAWFGAAFEDSVLFVVMEKFGGKPTALGEVFNFSSKSSLGSRKVTLVSLIREDDGKMSSCDVSWATGPSDCFGFKARDVDGVRNFFRDPQGKAFLFPPPAMGPDGICFFRDDLTQELIMG